MEGTFRDRRTFSRIAATLLALALLAERAAGRSFPVRFLVLAVLWRAEAIARAFVAREIEADGWCLDEPPATRGGAADAERLALRLRMLATMLGMLANADAGSDDRFDVRTPRPDIAPRLAVLLVVRLPAGHICRPYDTS